MNFSYLRFFKKPIADRLFVKHRLGKLTVGVITCFVFSGTHVSASENTEVLSLSEAIQLTLEHHPKLTTFVHKIEAAKGLIDQAGVSERANIHLTVEDFAGSGEFSSFDGAQTTLSIDWLLQSHVIAGRVKSAQAASGQQIIEQQITALDLSAQTSRLYIQGLVEKQRLSLAEEAVQQARDTLSAIGKRVTLGKSPEFERLQAEVTLAQRELAVEDLHHTLLTTFYALGAQWSNFDHRYDLSGDLFKIPQLADADEKFEQLLTHPALDLLVTKQRIAASKVELSRIQAKPQWRISTGIRRFEATDDFGLVAGLSVPLGKDRSSEGKIRRFYAQQEEYIAEYTTLHQQLKTQLYSLLQEIKHSTHVIDALEQKIIPSLTDAENLALSAYESGKLSYTQWSDILNKKLIFEQELLTAYETIHMQHIELQRLTGTSLSF